MAEEATAGFLAERIDGLREHIMALAAAVPTLPEQFARVGEQIAQESAARGHGALLTLNLVLLLTGFALEGVYRWFVKPKPHERLAAIGLRFARDAGAVAAFAL